MRPPDSPCSRLARFFRPRLFRSCLSGLAPILASPVRVGVLHREAGDFGEVAEAAPEEPAEPSHRRSVDLAAFLRSVLDRDPAAKHVRKLWRNWKGFRGVGAKCLILLVGVAGFEPATPSSRTRCPIFGMLKFLIFSRR
jgi:hypothetical protein